MKSEYLKYFPFWLPHAFLSLFASQELLARPHSANWNGKLPFEIGRQREQLPFHPFETVPSWAPETYGRLWSGFREHRKSWGHSVAHLFPSLTLSSQTSREHRSQAWSSSRSPWQPQKDEEVLISPGQGGSFSLSSQPWTIPREATRLRRDLSQEWQRTSIVQGPEDHPTESPAASTTITREVPREESSSSGCSREELNNMSVRWNGRSLACSPQGRSQAAMLFRDTTGKDAGVRFILSLNNTQEILGNRTFCPSGKVLCTCSEVRPAFISRLCAQSLKTEPNFKLKSCHQVSCKT